MERACGNEIGTVIDAPRNETRCVQPRHVLPEQAARRRVLESLFHVCRATARLPGPRRSLVAHRLAWRPTLTQSIAHAPSASSVVIRKSPLLSVPLSVLSQPIANGLAKPPSRPRLLTFV